MVCHRKEYVRSFACESLSYLIRKLPDDGPSDRSLSAHISEIMRLATKESNREARLGVSELLFMTVKVWEKEEEEEEEDSRYNN